MRIKASRYGKVFKSAKQKKNVAKKKTEEIAEEKVVNLEVKEEKESKPGWVKMKSADVEKLVIELAEKGETPSKIGMILRDQHGVPRVKSLGKKVTHILKEKQVKHSTDKEMIQKNIDVLKVHVEKNKHDYTATKALTKKLWALQRVK
jgi:ribosomal protein S15P/S13E